MSQDLEIIEFEERFRKDVIGLRDICELTRTWNDPDKDIDRIISSGTGKLFLLVTDDRLLGTVMTGYDGRRGSVYYLSVHPGLRGGDLGRKLMEHCEEYLQSQGCPKLNLNVRTTNLPVTGFYDRLGYQKDEVATMSKTLLTDQ